MIAVASCRYCTFPPDDAWAASDGAIAVPPETSITPGHVTIVPRRHVPGFYDLDVQEQRAVWDLVGSVKAEMAKSMGIASVQLGFEDSPPGIDGHAVVHLVPVRAGRVPNLPGGIEWVADGVG